MPIPPITPHQQDPAWTRISLVGLSYVVINRLPKPPTSFGKFFACCSRVRYGAAPLSFPLWSVSSFSWVVTYRSHSLHRYNRFAYSFYSYSYSYAVLFCWVSFGTGDYYTSNVRLWKGTWHLVSAGEHLEGGWLDLFYRRDSPRSIILLRYTCGASLFGGSGSGHSYTVRVSGTISISIS